MSSTHSRCHLIHPCHSLLPCTPILAFATVTPPMFLSMFADFGYGRISQSPPLTPQRAFKFGSVFESASSLPGYGSGSREDDARRADLQTKYVLRFDLGVSLV